MKYQIVCKDTKISPVVQEDIIKRLSRLEKMLFKSDEFECRVVVKFRNNKSKVEVTIPTPYLLLRSEVEAFELVEAIDMGTDAASGWILGELEEGNDFPKPSSHDEIEVEEGSFVNLLVLDMDEYTRKYGNKSIRRNVTIPAWLDTFGEKHNVNFSRILQDALLEMAQK